MQIGFGWTNGTLLGLMNRYPQNTRKVLDKNPLSDQPSQQPLPPVDAWNANGPDIAVTDKSPLKGVPLSALHTEETQNQKQEEPSTPHASASTPTETSPRMRKELEPNSIPLPVQPFMTPTPTPLLNEAIQHAP